MSCVKDVKRALELHGWSDVLKALRSCAEDDAQVYADLDPESSEVEALEKIARGLAHIIKGR